MMWLNGVDNVEIQFSDNPFDNGLIPVARSLKSVGSLAYTLEVSSTRINKHGSFDLVSEPHFEQENVGESGLSRRQHLDVKQFGNLRIGTISPPELAVDDPKHRSVEDVQIRTLPDTGVAWQEIRVSHRSVILEYRSLSEERIYSP
jgi:hypothetical protein